MELGRRRGTVLIVCIGVLAILTALVLTLARSMRVEAVTSANYAAAVQAEAVEQAGEAYAISLIVNQADQALHLDESNFMQIPVGQPGQEAGYFWIIRPNYDDPQLPMYGLIDESAKFNLNMSITGLSSQTVREMFLDLPGVTDDMADALVGWKDGTDSQLYSMMPYPYQAKQGSLESVEELLLVRGFTREFLYGQSMAGGRFIPYSTSGGMVGGTGMMGTGGIGFDPSTYRGIFDYLTVYSTAPATTTAVGGGGGNGGGGNSGGGGGGGSGGGVGTVTTVARGKINVNTAPREVLACFKALGLTDGDIDAMITARQSSVQSNPTDYSWLQTAVRNSGAIQQYITGQAFQYSADVVAVSANGRGFKRVRVVIDVRSGTPKIVYRRDLTEFGWPLEEPTLEQIRENGITPGAVGSVGTGSVRRTM